jgi:hypothetical protein
MPPSLSFPPAAAIEVLDGSNWALWSSRFLALLRMNGQRKHVTADKDPADKEWDDVEEMILGVFEMYVQKDVWAFVTDETKFKTCKLKWEELKRIYGGTASMATFNTWVALTSTMLDESSPMFPQLQKLNDARNTLAEKEMTITDLQFCFILIKSLPESYASVASTLLAIGAPADLSAQTIQARIVNEENRRKILPVASLNKVAPVKKKGDKAGIKCYYCQKIGHKSNECRKKKKDEADRKDKAAGAQAPGKSVNAHIVPTTAFITEVPDTDNEDLRVSLYAVSRSRWIVDSGATHHISPVRSDFATWSPADGW